MQGTVPDLRKKKKRKKLPCLACFPVWSCMSHTPGVLSPPPPPSQGVNLHLRNEGGKYNVFMVFKWLLFVNLPRLLGIEF